jgi:hypothetical protein
VSSVDVVNSRWDTCDRASSLHRPTQRVISARVGDDPIQVDHGSAAGTRQVWLVSSTLDRYLGYSV